MAAYVQHVDEHVGRERADHAPSSNSSSVRLHFDVSCLGLGRDDVHIDRRRRNLFVHHLEAEALDPVLPHPGPYQVASAARGHGQVEHRHGSHGPDLCPALPDVRPSGNRAALQGRGPGLRGRECPFQGRQLHRVHPDHLQPDSWQPRHRRREGRGPFGRVVPSAQSCARRGALGHLGLLERPYGPELRATSAIAEGLLRSKNRLRLRLERALLQGAFRAASDRDVRGHEGPVYLHGSREQAGHWFQHLRRHMGEDLVQHVGSGSKLLPRVLGHAQSRRRQNRPAAVQRYAREVDDRREYQRDTCVEKVAVLQADHYGPGHLPFLRVCGLLHVRVEEPVRW
mmetsp:Transcript_17519/g.48021  ORF Transcript_17519/g.48021 Transcript_17519/m.48021 type:complete len:341 (+) Transcript_17519:503-1525(+)